ncbi:MAG: PPK2 family polyphosphate kinase [Actinomycetota bacterium]
MTDVYRIDEGAKVRLSKLATRDDALFDGDKQAGLPVLDELSREIAGLQRRLFAEDRHRVLVVLQGMDTSGKSSTIRDVFRYTNSLGVHAVSFGKPSEEELQRDYLWRIHAHAPRRGEIVVFDRSHYEDVTVVRVLDLVDRPTWKRRFAHIRDFERMLVDEGTTIVKLFLHISADEQAEQLRERIDDPEVRWKFNPSDLEARAAWDDYESAWEDAIAETSTADAPWYVVPADRRWYRKLVVARILRDTLAELDPQYPEVDEDLTPYLDQL